MYLRTLTPVFFVLLSSPLVSFLPCSFQSTDKVCQLGCFIMNTQQKLSLFHTSSCFQNLLSILLCLYCSISFFYHFRQIFFPFFSGWEEFFEGHRDLGTPFLLILGWHNQGSIQGSSDGVLYPMMLRELFSAKDSTGVSHMQGTNFSPCIRTVSVIPLIFQMYLRDIICKVCSKSFSRSTVQEIISVDDLWIYFESVHCQLEVQLHVVGYLFDDSLASGNSSLQ